MVQIVELNGIKWLKAKDLSQALGYTQTQPLLRRIERTLDGFNTQQIAEFGRSKAAIQDIDFLKFAEVVKPSLEGPDLDRMSELIEYVELDEKEGQSVVAKLDEVNKVSQPPKSATNKLGNGLTQPNKSVTANLTGSLVQPKVIPFTQPVQPSTKPVTNNSQPMPTKPPIAKPLPKPIKPSELFSHLDAPKSVNNDSNSKEEKEFWFDWLFGGVVKLFYSRTFRFFAALNVILWQSCEYGELILEVWNLTEVSTWAHIKAYGRAVGFETLILLLTMTDNDVEITKKMDDETKKRMEEKNYWNTIIKWIWLGVFCVFALIIGLCNVGVIEDEVFRQIIITIPLPFSILATTHLFLVSKK